jgi:hypothetical protein
MALEWLADYTDVVTRASQPSRTRQSRGTEAVVNALILAARDKRNGMVGDDTREAFENLWSLQIKSGELAGAWPWLNFRNEPWEAADSTYYGAAIAAIAAGTIPNHYLSNPDIQSSLKLLRAYLKRGEQAEHLFDRVMLLWASARMPGLLDRDQQQDIVAAALGKQQADGGWSLSTLAPWKRLDGTALSRESDGYATGLIMWVLQDVGIARLQPEMRKGLGWLAQHQDPSSGAWPGVSPNTDRNPASDIGLFMSDAATAYAVLALARSRQ